jgi:hypothetical protein
VTCIMHNSVCRNVVTMCKIPTNRKIYNVLSQISFIQKVFSSSDIVCYRVNLESGVAAWQLLCELYHTQNVCLCGANSLYFCAVQLTLFHSTVLRH